jgi:hypothetical protein
MRTIAATLALAGGFTALGTGIAQAQGYYDRHEHHDRHWHGSGYVYDNPGAYYAAPPPVYFAPSPPSPAIDFVFPLHIR